MVPKVSDGLRGEWHRLVTSSSPEPSKWPRPWIVQEYVRLDRPKSFALYSAGRETFGWVTRIFQPATRLHVGGSRPRRPIRNAPGFLSAERCPRGPGSPGDGFVGFLRCADLLRRPSGEWVVLEVGTDGVFNHVDRDLGDAELEKELCERVAGAFWDWVTPEN